MPTFRRPGSDAGPRAGSEARAGTGPRAGTGRIRYAHGGLVPRIEPLCTVPPGEYGHHGDNGGADAVGGSGMGMAMGIGDGELGGAAWSARFPVTGRRNDLWVLVCGGIAAVAAFAAAFVASGGLASHPATPASVPAVVSQACPSPIP